MIIDEGKVKVKALETDSVVVTTEVIVAGAVSNNTCINLPGVSANPPTLTDNHHSSLPPPP
ncbi:pyruvate kinase, partial [Mycetocola zhadangensis]